VIGFESLIGMMAVTVVAALALIAYLLKSVRKSRSAKQPQAGSMASETVSPPSEPVVESRSLEQSAKVEHSSAAPPLVPDPEISPPEPQVSRPAEALLLQVWQNPDGLLVVQVGDRRYSRLFDIRDGAVGRQVLETIEYLVAFSKGEVMRTRPLSPPDQVVPPPRPAPALAQDVSQPKPTPKPSRLSTDPVPLRRRTEAQVKGITLNLADEIDKFLQIRVSASPEYSERYIHVASAPDGGLRFVIDNTRYNALDEVPEPDVQALVRAAIADWESQR